MLASDPFCEIECVDASGKAVKKALRSKTIDKTLTPVWNESFTLDITGSDGALVRFAFVCRSRGVAREEFRFFVAVYEKILLFFRAQTTWIMCRSKYVERSAARCVRLVSIV